MEIPRRGTTMRQRFNRMVLVSLLLGGLAIPFQNCANSKFSGSESSSRNSADNGYPYEGKIFADADATCAAGPGIRSRIRLLTATSAELLTANCQDVTPPQLLALGAYAFDAGNSDILIYQQRTAYAEQPALPRVPVINLATPSTLTGARGGTVVVNHNFAAAPMARDFTIFVNFVNTAGVSIFFDNHQPPTPTSIWSGPVAYSRTVTIPAAIAPGLYKIVAGIYEFNPVSGQYENQSLLTGSGVVIDGGPGNFQIGTVQVL